MDTPISFHNLDEISTDDRTALLSRTESNLDRYIDAVKPIIKAVKEESL